MGFQGEEMYICQMSFDLQPTLIGDVVTLRALDQDDFEELYAVASDRLIWEQHPNNDRYKRDVFERFFRGAMGSGGAFAVIDLATGGIIGSTRYHGYDPDKSEVEIGWTFLARSHWGGRYNGEMKRLMLAHAFKFVESVVFLVGPANIRSQRAVERIGAVRDGSRPNAAGRVSFVYRIVRSQEGPSN